MIDGCGRFGALLRIILPLAAPGVAATAIFAFVSSWSELLFAITFTSQTEMRTLSAGLVEKCLDRQRSQHRVGLYDGAAGEIKRIFIFRTRIGVQGCSGRRGAGL